jgi:hypothetical protein
MFGGVRTWTGGTTKGKAEGELTSGAEARTCFTDLSGTTEIINTYLTHATEKRPFVA